MLAAYGIPSTIINAISLLYEKTEARIITSNDETELFKMSKGVLKCDILAHFLFIKTLDYVMRQVIGENEYNLGFKIKERR